MSRTDLARRAALAAAGMLAVAAAASPAGAQRRNPIHAQAADQPPTTIATTPYPGATVTVDRRWPPRQPVQGVPVPLRRHYQPYPPAPAVVYYVPVPSPYPYYPAPGYGYGYGGGGGGVYDTNGRPLSSGYETAAPAPAGGDFPAATPDLSGFPYVVIEGGVMLVELGYGDKRAFPSCALLAAERAPDGQPRTLFYRPPADGLVLRPGQRGQVLGNPPVGAQACYTTNSFGRVVLDY